MACSYTYVPIEGVIPNLILEGGLDRKNIKAIADLEFNALVLKYNSWKDLTPLLDFKDKITNIRIRSDDVDLATISQLDHLKILRIDRDLPANLDFSALTQLEYLSTCWNKGHSENLFSLKNLKGLELRFWKETNLKKLAQLKNIVSLKLMECSKIESLEGISSLDNLLGFTAFLTRKLTDISEISACKNINYLYFEGCKNINSYDSLNQLKKLIELHIISSAPVSSLSFLKNKKDFDSILMGDNKILDGDLSILDELPNLKVCLIKTNPGYNRQFKDIEKALTEKWGMPMREIPGKWVTLAKEKKIIFY